MYTHSVSPSAVGVGQLAERPGDELAGALLVLKASVTSWTSANPATRRSGRRDISRWVATASKWLRRKPTAA
jgi:hypothetical protein